jgi:beta-glucosidase
MSGNFSKCILAVVFTGLLVFTSYPQDINLTGTVKDGSAKAIAGARVGLAVQNTKFAITDAAGAFSITGSVVGVVFGPNRTVIKTPCFRNNCILFGVSASEEQVRAEVFTLSGRRASLLIDKKLSAGNYRLDPFWACLAGQICIVKLQAGGRSSVFRIPSVGAHPAAGVRLTRLAGESGSVLAKSAAAADTIVVSAAGYKGATKAIDSYIGTHDFILEAAAFSPLSPADSAMICDTHRPILTWNADPRAVRYEVWLNVSRKDYDWFAPGALLDRYTKVGEVTGTTYTCDSLPDRWTYKWYVVSVDGSGNKSKSGIRVFSKYLPALEQVADNVPLLAKGTYQCRDLNKNGTVDPYEDWKNPIDVRVNNLLSQMTDEEKTMQLFYNAGAYPIAGWQMGKNGQTELYNRQIASAKTRLGIPIITAGDQIHGYENAYPTQPALAASRDPFQGYACADLQRQEELFVGARGLLAPLAELGTKVLYPRIQEGNGENAELGEALMRAMHAGFNDGPELNPRSIITTTKHWPGEGAGGEGGITYDSVTLIYHMKPWIAAIEGGMAQVMTGYAPAVCLDKTYTKAGISKPICDYLRNQLHFDGLICTDWLPSGDWANSVKAGHDVLGGANPGDIDMAGLLAATGMELITTACKRILRTKFKMGMFDNPYGSPDVGAASAFFKTADKKAVWETATKKSLTLLKNSGVLPLKLAAGDKIVVGGPAADNVNYYKAWNTPVSTGNGAKSIQAGIVDRATQAGVTVYTDGAVHADAKAAVLAVGEPSYTHGTSWPKEQDFLPADQVNLIKSFKDAGIPTVVVYILPRPFVLANELAYCDAILIAYRPGNGAGVGVASVVFGDYVPHGRLPFQLPKAMTQVGLDNPQNEIEKWDIPYDLGSNDAERLKIKTMIKNNQIVNSINGDSLYGDPLFQYGAGLQGWK